MRMVVATMASVCKESIRQYDYAPAVVNSIASAISHFSNPGQHVKIAAQGGSEKEAGNATPATPKNEKAKKTEKVEQQPKPEEKEKEKKAEPALPEGENLVAKPCDDVSVIPLSLRFSDYKCKSTVGGPLLISYQNIHNI
ncbi:unnamed protein product [Heligmosomoides polygyrus]|uniref:RPN2_C domain-containing protein n=1 Tax=Heligmosomoides polygyrus TaxID=6339 RepID=A0A183FJZ8_HELPZ|nr:unnamed protein product [Heligmosomoides polygyrus]